MTTDLWMLVAAAGLHWIIVMIAATPKILINGVPWAAGNRDEPGKDLPGWAVRTEKLSANMLENLPLFTVLVLVAHVSGNADELSAMGAMIFVGARVGHALAYMGGVAYLRTLIWIVSIVGLCMIAYTIVV